MMLKQSVWWKSRILQLPQRLQIFQSIQAGSSMFAENFKKNAVYIIKKYKP